MSRRAVRLLNLGGMLLGASLGLFGCVRMPDPADSLTIATSWSESERSQLEKAFEGWIANKSDPEPFGTEIKIVWVTLDREADLAQVVGPRRRRWDPRPAPPDIVLGGPPSSYQRLARLGKLAPIDQPEQPLWDNVHRAPLGWAVRAKANAAGAPPVQGATAGEVKQERPARLAFDDPRHDPVTLAWAKHELNTGSWAEGYARLVQDAGHARRIGRQAGSTLAAVARGEVEATPATALDVKELPPGSSVQFLPVDPATEWVEGAAIVAGAGPQRFAQLFFRFLNETGQAETPRADATGGTEVDSLLADLLGATLVDAQDELWTAWITLKQAGRPPRAALMWLTQAPPWPPASIEKMEGDNAEVLVQTLIEQLAPDAELRAWLSRSWLGTKRQVDGSLLEEIAHAADGRLVREPRFRAWLRAEWTAWARQRYRRVTRTVIGLKP